MYVRSVRVAKSLDSRLLPQQMNELHRNRIPPTTWKTKPTPCENARGRGVRVGGEFSILATSAFLDRQDFQARRPPARANRLNEQRRQIFGLHLPRQHSVIVVQPDILGPTIS